MSVPAHFMHIFIDMQPHQHTRSFFFFSPLFFFWGFCIIYQQCVRKPWICGCACAFVCLCVYGCVNVSVPVCACMCLRVPVCACVCLCMLVHVCVHEWAGKVAMETSRNESNEQGKDRFHESTITGPSLLATTCIQFDQVVYCMNLCMCVSSRDVFMYVCMYVCMQWKRLRGFKYVSLVSYCSCYGTTCCNSLFLSFSACVSVVQFIRYIISYIVHHVRSWMSYLLVYPDW